MNFAEVQVLMLLGSRRRRPPRRHGPSRRPEHCAFAADGRARQLPYPYQLQCDASLPTTCGSRSSLFSARRPCSSLLFRGGESGARPFQFGIPLARHPVVPALIGTVSSVGSSSSSTRRHGYVHVFTLSVALTWSGQPRAEAGRLRRLEGRPSCVKASTASAISGLQASSSWRRRGWTRSKSRLFSWLARCDWHLEISLRR